MPYMHIELDIQQQSKKSGQPCGDVVLWERRADATWVILADGVGSGIKANLAATFTAQRLLTLLCEDVPMREAFASVVADSERAKKNQGPYTAITLVQILNDGHTTALMYEIPLPIAIDTHYAFSLEAHKRPGSPGPFNEAVFDLKKNDALILMSDGVTQAGLGGRMPAGWGEPGVVRYINRCFQTKIPVLDLAPKILEQAWRLDGSAQHDDITVVRLFARTGQVVNILSGPPEDKAHDTAVVQEFINAYGIKVVCGTSTAALTARETGRTLKMGKASIGYVEPPRYELPGVDMVTEGAVTLNQVYNLLDEAEVDLPNPNSGVASLYSLLRFADRVNWFVGRAANPAHHDIRFTQMGVLPRLTIIPLLAEKLKAQGKLVVVHYR